MKTKTKILREDIRDFIISQCALRQKPMTEEMIATRFNVSRTPIREVLKGLEDEGLIETRRKRGISFREPSDKDIEDIYDLRTDLECFAVRTAVNSITPEDIKDFERLAVNYTKCLRAGDTHKMSETDRLFHEKIINLSGNILLGWVFRKLKIHIATFRIRYQFHSEAEDANPYSHKNIVDALKTGNAGVIAETLQKHIGWSKNDVLSRKKRLKYANRKSTGGRIK